MLEIVDRRMGIKSTLPCNPRHFPPCRFLLFGLVGPDELKWVEAIRLRAMVVICVLLAMVAAGCRTQGIVRTYCPLNTDGVEVEPLTPGQVPKIVYTGNLIRDQDDLLAKGYIAVGYSTFFGYYTQELEIKLQAEAFGASVVLIRTFSKPERQLDTYGLYYAKRTNLPPIGIIFRDMLNLHKQDSGRVRWWRWSSKTRPPSVPAFCRGML